MKVELRRVPEPDFGASAESPSVPVEEYERRADRLYEAVDADWVLVYGDREHSANLAWVSGHDPRFEEAVLVLGEGGLRVLVVGNEGRLYAPLAALPMDLALCQSFSLLGQPRDAAPRLASVLRDIGLATGDRVAIAGWKYLESVESDSPDVPAFVPALIVGAVRTVTASDPSDCTKALMDPVNGLRVHNSVAQLAAFEWAAVRASQGVRRIVCGTKPGMTEYEAAASLEYEGDPLSCHVMLTSGTGPIIGLRSPTSRRINRGDGVSTAVGYWGGLCCRAGLVTPDPDEAFVNAVVAPYFSAIVAWYGTIGIGVTGGDINDAVMAELAAANWRPLLNPGHQISLEEWIHTPVWDGSRQRIASSMALQSDIIPYPMPPGWTLNCEDTIAIADEGLRSEFAETYPDAWARITARRAFMRDELGIPLSDEVLPLSALPAYLPPFWLEDSIVCAVAQ